MPTQMPIYSKSGLGVENIPFVLSFGFPYG
jgi:hypothetical protein